MFDLIIDNIGQLLTMQADTPRRGAHQGDLGIIVNGAVAIQGGKIARVGPSDQILPLAASETVRLDAGGGVVLPGFVDAHTHVVYAGERAAEFEMRIGGASYLDIMRAGGGIMQTVRQTRAATPQELVTATRARLDRMLENGTTTVEAKTGYGLNTVAELGMLEAITALDATHPLDLVPTFIGAHAIPEEYAGRGDAFTDLVVREMLPAVKAWCEQRAAALPFCDVFCDEGAFTLEQSRRILEAARALGMPLKIHADEFANLGGAMLAAELGATSADHLMVTRRAEMRALAAANVVAVLLPGTTFGLGKHDFAGGRAFIEENVPVALGTDLNPGTSWCESMPMMLAIATRYEGLTVAEALVAATLNAAYACGRAAEVGSLQPGKLADVLIAEAPDYRHLAYRYGGNPVRTVVKRGRVAWERP